MPDELLKSSNGESKVRRILFNEVSLIFGVVAVVLSGFIYLTNPYKDVQMDVQQIKNELESHQELSSQMQNLKDNDLHTLQLKMDEQQKTLIEIQKQIAVLQVLINKK